MAAPVIFDCRAVRFRWPRRSFSMAAPVGFDGRAGRQLCPYEAQYYNISCFVSARVFTGYVQNGDMFLVYLSTQAAVLNGTICISALIYKPKIKVQ